MKHIVELYFDKFSNKDLNALEKMFTPDVELIDWEINVKGINEVLAANKNIFENVDSIKVTPLKIAIEGNTVFAELLITVLTKGELSFLNVVDVVTLHQGKISSIHAFKR